MSGGPNQVGGANSALFLKQNDADYFNDSADQAVAASSSGGGMAALGKGSFDAKQGTITPLHNDQNVPQYKNWEDFAKHNGYSSNTYDFKTKADFRNDEQWNKSTKGNNFEDKYQNYVRGLIDSGRIQGKTNRDGHMEYYVNNEKRSFFDSDNKGEEFTILVDAEEL